MTSHLGKTRGWAAVVFDEAGVAIATARLAGNELSIVSETAEPHVPVDGQAMTARYQATAQVLRQRVDLREYQIVTAIGGDDVLCQTLRLPTTDAGELKQMLELQIDSLTPLPVEEIVYSFEALATTATETRILLAVASKAAVNERVAALEAVGWRPEVVSVDTLAVFRELLRQGTVPADDRLNTLVLLSPTVANFIVFSSGHIITVRSVMLGDKDFIREELTRTRLAAEVEYPGLAHGTTLFATWSEPLRAMLTELAEGLGMLVDSVVSPPVLSVCLDTARDGSARLNLLPEEWRERRRKLRVRQVAVRSLIGLGTAYLLALVIFLTLLGVKKVQIRRVDDELRRLQSQYAGAQELRKTLLTMQKQLDTQHSALEVLREVSQLLPDSVKLSGLSFKQDNRVTLRGKAQAAGFASEFIGRLDKSAMFTKVTPGEQRIEPGTGLTKFDVECSLPTVGAGHGVK
ncbi:MAG: pilus assembly protein PilM [Verrucomicrobiota bacterium]